jgi:membrane protease subunit HflK
MFAAINQRLKRVLMSLNDPQWGRRGGGGGGNQGPPDLDELWRRFNRRLNDMMGNRQQRRDPSEPDGGGGGGGPRLPQMDFRQWRRGIAIIAGIVVLLWLASGIYIVGPAERGVVLTFGQMTRVTEPGPGWHVPWPVERVEVVNVTGVRTFEIGYRNNPRNRVLRESLMLTRDENIVDLQFAVQYDLKNPSDFLFNVRNPDETVRFAAETAMRQIVGLSLMDHVLYEQRERVALEARTLMQTILDRYQTGVRVIQVSMQGAAPPEQVQAAFDDAVRAGQDRERQKSEGEAYANDVIPRARGAASRLLEEAEGHRQRVVATAEGEASRFRQIVAEYNRAPRVTRDRLYLEALQQVLTNATKVVVDSRATNNMLFLPLDRIMQMTAAGDGGAAAGAPALPAKPAEPQAQAPEPTARTREAFRAREREPR